MEPVDNKEEPMELMKMKMFMMISDYIKYFLLIIVFILLKKIKNKLFTFYYQNILIIRLSILTELEKNQINFLYNIEL